MDLSAFFAQYSDLLVEGLIDTSVMVFGSTFGAYLFGIPLGVLLFLWSPAGLYPRRVLYAVYGWIINMGRSLPLLSC